MHERRFNPAQAHKLDAPERGTWLPVNEVLAQLALFPGMTIGDIGAGTGYFTLPMASAVGEAGRVYAVDVEPRMLELIQDKLTGSRAANVQCVQGEASATNLADAACDLVFMANVWHEFDSHPAVLKEVTRILKPGGRIAILDWCADLDSPPGPPKAHRIPKQDVCDLLAKSGFKALSMSHAGKYSYLVQASRA